MLRKGLFVLSSAALCFFLVTDLYGDEQQPDANYFPVKSGSKWYYKVGEIAGVVMVKRIEKINGIENIHLEATCLGSTVESDLYSISATGIFLHTVLLDKKFAKPLCIFKYPVTPGEAWTEVAELGGEKVNVSIRIGQEVDVQVPAGKFKAIPVEMNVDKEAAKIEDASWRSATITSWYATGVGLVKRSSSIGGPTFTIELQKYEPGT